MPLNARRLIRRMRGGAQAHLMEADDGNCYVVKFTNNPQHRRILVNEAVAAVFLKHLQIATPPAGIIHLRQEFLEQNPDLYLQLGTRRIPVPPGWHWGSRFPGNPETTNTYDFLPDSLLQNVVNNRDFVAVLPFDQWMSNSDGRQAVFFRARLQEWLPAASSAPPRKLGFVVAMIDQGFVFNGPHWELPDSPLFGLYMRRCVYEQVTSLDSFQPWLDRIVNFPEEVFDDAYKQIPPEWLEGPEERDHLERLLERLLKRRKRVPALIESCRHGGRNPFPNWS
jgi:hypothetical protein